MSNKPHGHEEGDRCSRNCCAGRVELRPVVNCSCHIAPPCSACTAPRHFCATCGWEEAEDVALNDHIVSVDRKTGAYVSWEWRKLDASRIDWHSLEHTHFSMRKRGVYPPGTSIEEVQRAVNGTFGGRFEQFGNGAFDFVAYTD